MAPELFANLGQGLTGGVELSGLIDLGGREATVTPRVALALKECGSPSPVQQEFLPTMAATIAKMRIFHWTTPEVAYRSRP
jgi:hypothetical protein